MGNLPPQAKSAQTPAPSAPTQTFDADPTRATHPAPVPWHRQNLEEALLRVDLKEVRPSRLHIHAFPVRLAVQFRHLGKTADLRRMSARHRQVVWYGLEVLKAMDELKLLLATQVRNDLEGDVDWNMVNPMSYHYTLSDTRLHLTHQAQIAVSRESHDELETMAAESGVSESTLCVLTIIAAFSRSKEWVDRGLVNICRTELEVFRHSLYMYVQELEEHANLAQIRQEAVQEGQDRQAQEEAEDNES